MRPELEGIEDIKVFADRYVNRWDAYYKQWAAGNRFGLTAVYSPVTESLIRSHLDGNLTLSLPAADSSANSKWCGWDEDDQSGNLAMVQEVLVSLGWHPLREGARQGRSGHLWLMLDAPLSASDLRLFDRQIRHQSGVSAGSLEFFPKSDRVDKLGSNLRLPLGVHLKPGADKCRGWFEGAPHTVADQLKWFASQPLNPARRLQEVVSLARCEKERLAKIPTRHFKALDHKAYGCIDFAFLAQAALARSSDVVNAWLPNGRRSGSNYIALNPRRGDDEHLGSFRVNLVTGIWKDFATVDAKGGDLISLVAYLDDCRQFAAATKLARFFGMDMDGAKHVL